MRRFFLGIILGIVFGALGYWYLETKALEHPVEQQRYEQAASRAASSAVAAAGNISDALKAKLDTLDLRAEEIRAELQRNGEIVRHEARDIGAEAVSAASDARAVAEIKAKYLADPSLSVWKISVSCNQGHVTLSGDVSTAQDIGKAVAEALEADGVRDVTSTIHVKSK